MVKSTSRTSRPPVRVAASLRRTSVPPVNTRSTLPMVTTSPSCSIADSTRMPLTNVPLMLSVSRISAPTGVGTKVRVVARRQHVGDDDVVVDRATDPGRRRRRRTSGPTAGPGPFQGRAGRRFPGRLPPAVATLPAPPGAVIQVWLHRLGGCGGCRCGCAAGRWRWSQGWLRYLGRCAARAATDVLSWRRAGWSRAAVGGRTGCAG